MAEFPAKVSTETSTPEATGGGWICPGPDISFLRSVHGILMMLEIGLGLIVWALIASSYRVLAPAYEWVLFASIFCWLLTIILFTMILLQLTRKIPAVPWPLTIFVYNVVATVLYITAFITCAAAVGTGIYDHDTYNKRAAASIFACVVMIAYGGSTFFSFREWRGANSS